MASHHKISLVIIACGVTTGASALAKTVLAADQTWTCSYEAAAGLKWDGSRWQTADFPSARTFTLIVRNAGLTADSAALPLSSSGRFVQCPSDKLAVLSCFDPSGGWLVFDPKTGHGGVSKIYTAIKDPPNRGSTLSVAPFSCSMQ
jgi:hypothetical protein